MAMVEFGSNYQRKDLENMLHGVTTPLYVNNGKEINGTGFFYYELPKIKSEKDKKIYEDIWLVTNRHLILEDDNIEKLKSLKFHTRHIGNDNRVYWNRIAIDTPDLSEDLRLYHDGRIDIAVIKVTDKIEKYHPNLNLLEDFGFFAVSEALFPENVDQQVESGDDVVIVGYPRGLYIQENLYPIIKSSCISSKWGSYFDGNPYFLIDTDLVSGSSGSLVITKPTNFTLSEGKIIPHEVKQFMFLGIYSAEHTPQLVGTGSGIVWYGNLIKDVILSAVKNR